MTQEAVATRAVVRIPRTVLDPGPVSRAGLNLATTPRLGLQFTKQMPFESWLTVGRQLSSVATSSAWCLGDWMIYGETTYSGRYRDAVEQTSLDYQTLRNYAWVARRFAYARRHAALSFGHHAEVASLSDPEQDYWLRKAEDLGWSRNRLRREVRASLGERVPLPPDGTPGGEEVRIQLRLTPIQLELCESAAKRAGIPVEVWAMGVLEQVARAEGDDARPLAGSSRGR